MRWSYSNWDARSPRQWLLTGGNRRLSLLRCAAALTITGVTAGGVIPTSGSRTPGILTEEGTSLATVSLEPVYHAELIDGREIHKPLPKKLHVFVQRFLLLALTRDLPPNYLALPELNVLCGEDRLVPDLTVAARRAQYRDGDLAEPPCLAIEILSPGQTIAQLFDRAGRLCLAGTPVCWIIWPERRRAWLYSSEDLTEAKDILTAPLPEGAPISIRLAEIWADLD